MKNVHWVNPMGSILVPVAVTTRGNLSFVRLSLSESKVLRLIQLMEAPVSYSAFIFTLLQVIGKTVPVAGPTAIVQVSTKCVSCYLHLCNSRLVHTASVVNLVDWVSEHLPVRYCRNVRTFPQPL